MWPLGTNDDMIDALAMQLEMWKATIIENKQVVLPFNRDPLGVQDAIEELEVKAHRRRDPSGRVSVMDVYEHQGVLEW